MMASSGSVNTRSRLLAFTGGLMVRHGLSSRSPRSVHQLKNLRMAAKAWRAEDGLPLSMMLSIMASTSGLRISVSA